MSRNNTDELPIVVEVEILAERMERALRKPDLGQSLVEHLRRHAKAGTYTLAEKYALVLDGFKERR